MRHAIALAVLFLLISGCVTPKVVHRFDVHQSPFPTSLQGRTVDVELTTGERLRLTNPTYENGWLTGMSVQRRWPMESNQVGGLRQVPRFYVRTVRISANEAEAARKEKFGIFFGISIALAYWQFNPLSREQDPFPILTSMGNTFAAYLYAAIGATSGYYLARLSKVHYQTNFVERTPEALPSRDEERVGCYRVMPQHEDEWHLRLHAQDAYATGWAEAERLPMHATWEVIPNVGFRVQWSKDGFQHEIILLAEGENTFAGSEALLKPNHVPSIVVGRVRAVTVSCA